MSPLPAQMTDHWWWRPGVRPGRGLLVWHILFDDQPTVQALARDYRERLDGIAGLDLVPEEWLHMTTQIVGFDDEISTHQRLKKMIDSVAERTRPLKPITLTLGKVLFHSEAVVVSTDPADYLDPLRAAIREAVAETIPAQLHQLADEPEWTPHVSVGYSNSNGPAQPIISALNPKPASCITTISQVHLVRQTRDGHLYRWDRLASVKLSGSASA